MNPDRRWFLAMLSAAGAAWAVEPLWPHRATTRPACLCGIPPADYQYGSRSPSVVGLSRMGLLLPNDSAIAAVLAATPPAIRSEDTLESFERQTRPSSDQLQIERRRTQSQLEVDGLNRREVEAGENSVEVLPAPSNSPIFRDRSETWRDVRTMATPPQLRPIETRRLYQLAQAELAIDHCSVSEIALVLESDGDWSLSLLAAQNLPANPQAAGYNPRLHIKRNEFHVTLNCLGAAALLPDSGLRDGRPMEAALDPCIFWVQNGQPRRIRWDGWNRDVADRLAEIDRVEVEFFYR